MSENARIGESARYFVANQPMRYGIEIVYSLEVEHCMCLYVTSMLVLMRNNNYTLCVHLSCSHSAILDHIMS